MQVHRLLVEGERRVLSQLLSVVEEQDGNGEESYTQEGQQTCCPIYT